MRHWCLTPSGFDFAAPIGREVLIEVHEIIGRVAKLGGDVSKFKVGDLAGVGCLVDSCRCCASCAEQLEQFCEKGPAFTYNGTESLQTDAA